jgi:cytochrome P450
MPEFIETEDSRVPGNDGLATIMRTSRALMSKSFPNALEAERIIVDIKTGYRPEIFSTLFPMMGATIPPGRSKPTYVTSGMSFIYEDGPKGQPSLMSDDGSRFTNFAPPVPQKFLEGAFNTKTGKDLAAYRSSIMRPLGATEAGRMVPVIEEIAEQCFDEAVITTHRRGEVNLSDIFNRISYLTIMKKTMSDMSERELDKFYKNYHAIDKALLGMPYTPGYWQARFARSSILRDVRGNIRNREKTRSYPQDALTYLLQMEEKRGIKGLAASAFPSMLLLQLAGHVTTGNWMEVFLIKMREEGLEAAVYDDLMRLDQISYDSLTNQSRVFQSLALEVVRVFPPACVTFRKVGEDVNYKGYDLEEGASMILDLYDALRDPAYFDEPYGFIWNRFLGNGKGSGFNFRTLPMGWGDGPHSCPGKFLSPIELATVMRFMLENYNVVIASEDLRLQPSLKSPTTVKAMGGLPARVYNRNPEF